MILALVEDDALYSLARTVFAAEAGTEVDNAQVSGLLTVIRASSNYALLRQLAQRQLDKARKEGERAEEQAAFYDRLLRTLREVEKYAEEYVRNNLLNGATGKLSSEHRKQVDRWAGRLALTFMTHVAAEHRWRGGAR